jgi:hypothetical protein
MRGGTPATALVEENDPVGLWIEKTAVVGLTPRPGASVEKQDRDSLPVPNLLQIELMPSAYSDLLYRKRLDGRI